MRRISAMFTVIALGVSTPSFALDICRTTVLRDVHALEDRSSVMRKGEHAVAVTQFRRERNGSTSFCSHGGYCYPAFIKLGGRNVAAQELANCTVDWSSGETDSDGETIYALKVDRSRNTPHDLRLYDIAERLLDLGASEAGSSNMAEAYVDRPRSACGRFASRVLTGDRRARSQLMNGEGVC